MQLLFKPRAGSCIVLAILILLVVSLPAIMGCNGDCPDEPVKHNISIVPDGIQCKLVGEEGPDVTVKAGHLVVYKNESGSDVELYFGRDMRLFGVTRAFVYNNSELQLMVLEGAEVSAHEYDVPCFDIEPGPKIIVDPPG